MQPRGARHPGITHKVNPGLTLCGKPSPGILSSFVALRNVNLGLTLRIRSLAKPNLSLVRKASQRIRNVYATHKQRYIRTLLTIVDNTIINSHLKAVDTTV